MAVFSGKLPNFTGDKPGSTPITIFYGGKWTEVTEPFQARKRAHSLF
jgi:hypothetical protein